MSDAFIYLDHHATTPCDPAVVAAMLPYFSTEFGNAASRTHRAGRRARNAVEAARQSVASMINADPREIIFTSGATEAINIALQGLARGAGRPVHFISTQIEHPAVLDTLEALSEQGHRVTLVEVPSTGVVAPSALAAAIGPDTVAICMMAANNEIGTLQPLQEVAALCGREGLLFVSDTTQWAGHLPLDMSALPVDLACVSAHKLYGPKGAGCLFLRKRRPALAVQAMVHGGGHERGLRSGTLNVPAIVGFGVAAALRMERMEADAARLSTLRDTFLEDLRTHLPNLTLNGSLRHRHPGNLNISLPGVEARQLMARLPDIALSTGSACASAQSDASHVLRAIGHDRSRSLSALRFGLGRDTTAEELRHTVAALTAAVETR